MFQKTQAQSRFSCYHLRAVAVEEARRETGVGSASLYTGRFTLESPFTVRLQNL